MENISILEDGITILCIGMGFVFLFLVIMVYVMDFTAFIIRKINNIFPEEIPDENKYSKKNKVTADSEIALAIALCYSKR